MGSHKLSSDIKQLIFFKEDGLLLVGHRSSYFGHQGNCVVLCLEEGCCQAEVEDGEATTDASRGGLWPSLQPASLHWSPSWRRGPRPAAGRFWRSTFPTAARRVGSTPTLWTPARANKCGSSFLCSGSEL